MATQESTARRPSPGAILFSWLFTGFIVLFVAAMLFLMWPALVARFTGVQPATPALPTAQVSVPQTRPVVAPVVVPDVQQSINDYNATATAQWQAVQQSAPIPNVDHTNDAAPVEVEEKPVQRMPAGNNVPTSEPLQQSPDDNQTGEKRVIVNPQATHQCLHGQVWVEDRGCKNP